MEEKRLKREHDEQVAADAKLEAEDRAEQARILLIENEGKMRRMAERDQEAAVAAERQRIADEQATKVAEDKRREANKSHRTKVNNGAHVALVKQCGLTDAQALAVVLAISNGMIANLKITY